MPESVLLESLRWRYSTKQFDATRKIPEPTWEALEEALVLAPSSFGLQPWRFVVVLDPKVREALLAHSWGQRQIVDASHLVVFAARRGLAVADVDRWIARLAEVRGVPVASLESYRNAIAKYVSQSTEKLDVDRWSALQVYLALGQFMTAAAVIGVDTCPMEGIVPAGYDEVLGLPARGYFTLCAATAGYRAQDDKYAAQPKARFAASEVVEHV